MRLILACSLVTVAACSSVDAGGATEEGATLTAAATTDGGSDAATSDAPTSAPQGTGEGTGSGDSMSGPSPGPTEDGTLSESASASDAATGDPETSSGDPTSPPPPDVPPGSTIPVDGGEFFLLGANYPWKSYGGDFGGNAWGTFGVHTKPAEYDADFLKMSGAGVQVVRWFVFTDGRAGVVFDNSGTPTGLGEHVLTDFDAAIGVARQHGVYLVPVLLDFHWMFWAKQENQVQMGGRSDTLSEPGKRDALVQNVIAPLLDQYAAEPTILAWEIMNEPEWGLSEVPEGDPDDQANPVKLADFYAFSAAVSAAVHERTGAYVTLGSASLKWLKIWTPAFASAHGLPPIDLDFYQVHYYPWMDGKGWSDHPDYGSLEFSPMDQSYDDLGLDRPLVVGEFILSDSAAARLDKLKGNGYAGAWPWSLNADYGLDLPGMQAWAQAQAGLVDLPSP